MPRVNHVAKARKSPGSCGRCSKKIESGAAYIWWKFRYGGKRVRCATCPRPRQSELTNSDKLSRCYGAGESVEDAIDAFRKDRDIDDLRSAVESAAEEVREVAEEYRESASNIESGFNGNRVPMCDELEEKADNLESKADEMESAAGQLEEFDEEAAKKEAEEELVEYKEGDREEKIKARVEEMKEEWCEEQASHVEECTDISPEG